MSAYTTTAPTKSWTTSRTIGALAGFLVLGLPILSSGKFPFLPGVLLAVLVTGAGAWIAPNLFKTQPPPGFRADFKTATMALDLTSNKLWVDPLKGKAFIIDGASLRKWTHQWSSDRNAWGHEFRKHNRIEFSTTDMHKPMFEVTFRTYDEAAAWHARLENWLNAS